MTICETNQGHKTHENFKINQGTTTTTQNHESESRLNYQSGKASSFPRT